jgi:hypothetical protein
LPFCQVPSEKRNKQPLLVGIKSEREIGTSLTPPPHLEQEGGELYGAIFFQ